MFSLGTDKQNSMPSLQQQSPICDALKMSPFIDRSARAGLPPMSPLRSNLDRRRSCYERLAIEGSKVELIPSKRFMGLMRIRQEAEHMFYHGFDNYMKHAFPEDELRPISCVPLTRDRHNPAHIELNDALGNYSLTLIDSLSTLAILASSSATTGGRNRALKEFQSGVAALIEQYGDGSNGSTGQGKRGRGFDMDSKVQVFETVIRGVGGLVSAHLFAVGELPIRGYEPKTQARQGSVDMAEAQTIRWSKSFVYDGQLLRLANDLARRLLPAFHTPTGLPYPRVNLRHGVPFYLNSPLNNNAEIGQCQPTQNPPGELTETCSAGAGSLVLEFTTLSRLTGDPRFEQLAKRAFWSVWERKSSIGLVGSGIDAESGYWTTTYTGIGAGIDSFYEYAAKASILLSGSSIPNDLARMSTNGSHSKFSQLVPEEQQTAEAFRNAWQESHASIKRHLYHGYKSTHPHYIQGDLYTGATRAFWLDSLSAFYPGLLATTGDLEEAIQTHLLYAAIWTRYSALPERWSSHTGSVESGLGWWGGRPEFIESTYHLYRATSDPWYLHVGEMVLRDIKRRCWTKCGWSGIQDVRSGDRSDRMESFFLGETTKYLFLLFDLDHPLNKMDAPFVFSTEGHPLIIPRHASKLSWPISATPRTKHGLLRLQTEPDLSKCPRAPPAVPFSLSATAARDDVFHAAKLARLHLMPTPDSLGSPLIEYSSDHPSISISDVRSPSNYTYFPWTLPTELVPYNGVCSMVTARNTFDITFPTTPNGLNGPGFLQRLAGGILINSMGGLRLGMIQDVPYEAGNNVKGEQYRVQAINNIMLGKDERIFLAKDTASTFVNPRDPNFTRIRNAAMLDLVVDVLSETGDVSFQEQNGDPTDSNTTSTTFTPEFAFDASLDGDGEDTSSMKQVFSALLQQVASLMAEQPPSPPPNPSQHRREYFPAVIPTGPGAAPLPDVDDARGPDIHGAPQGSLLWHSILVMDENCNGKLPLAVPKETQVIVIKRGECSFTQKLENIPTFAPSESSLQLVIVVSYEEDDPGVPARWLFRPLLESAQVTSSGLPRHNPISMVMVGGGEDTYETLRKAVGLGIKRRYSVQAQGIPISNLIIL